MTIEVKTYRQQIKKQLLEQFTEADLRNLILHFNIELEPLPHHTKADFVEAVFSYMARNGQLETLINTLRKQRHELSWPTIPTPAQQMADELIVRGQRPSEILPEPEIRYTLVFWFILLAIIVTVIMFSIYYNAVSSLN